MFILEVIVLNTVVTSREAILKTCREIVSKEGLPALNMRAVATACHVALGSLYNYFPSKEDLVMATIESVWQDIFHMDQPCHAGADFPEYAAWIFESVRQGALAYPNFFNAHSISFASAGKNKARETMQRYFAHMKMGMQMALENDASVRKDAFDAHFTKSDLIDYVLTSLLMLLVQQKQDCGVLQEMLRRTLY
jgi:AcrR family transcriptional regulator